MRRFMKLTVLSLLLVVLSSGALQADEEQGRREKAAASMADALRVRLEARTKRADLLAQAGRTKEALALLESVDALYEAGMAEIRQILARGAVGDERFEPAGRPDASPVRTFETISTKSLSKQRKAVEAAVLGGLKWLAAHQDRDGSWSPATFASSCNGRHGMRIASEGAGKAEHRVGVTGLALLAFLVHDYTHEGKHAFIEPVAKATAYLIKAQDPEGCIGPRTASEYIYGHAMAALALVEAYSLTRDARILPAAQRAISFHALSRNPYFGWRYGVKPGDNDTSVTHWMMLGISSARAVNQGHEEEGEKPVFVIDANAFAGSLAFVERMTDEATGRVGYIARGTGPARPQEQLDTHPSEYSEAMTAAGINLRLLAGQGLDHPSIRKGARLLQNLPPQWRHGGTRGRLSKTGVPMDMYYGFLGALAAQQIGGAVWEAWEPALLDGVAATARTDGDICRNKGSWDPIGPWGPRGGRVYSTALMVQTLAVVKAGLAAK